MSESFREPSQDEKEVIQRIASDCGVDAVLMAIAETHAGRADELDLEAAVTNDGAKFEEASLERREAGRLMTLAQAYVSGFDPIFEVVDA